MKNYNSTKGPFDSLYQMCRNNSYGRSTRDGLCVFYGIINLACLNSMIIYMHTYQGLKKAPLIRLQYLIKLSEELMTDWLQEGASLPQISHELRSTITGALPDLQEKHVSSDLTSEKGRKRTLSHKCPKKKPITTTYCNSYAKAFCKEHCVSLCFMY